MKKFKHPLGFLGIAVTLFALLVLTGGVLFWHSNTITVAKASGQATQAHLMFAHPYPQQTSKVSPNSLLFTCQLPNAAVRCYSPTQIHNAYSYGPLIDAGRTGKGQTIVIIDAFQDPTIRSDLATFDKTFNLPAPEFNIFAPQGLTPFNPHDPAQVSFAQEIALDVQWAHAIAQNATIDLVLAKSNNDVDLFAVTRFAVNHSLGSVISQSFGEAERCVAPALLTEEHQTFIDATAKGITLLASSGDEGAAQPTCNGKSFIKSVGYPASDPLVTSVGATQLVTNQQGGYKGETALNETDINTIPFTFSTGGGFSTIFSRPGYQASADPHSNLGRGVPDVAYSGSINDGVLAVFGGSFFIFGGTSVGSPQWAGIIAIKNQFQKSTVGFINPIIYAIGKSSAYSSTFHDITLGNNTFHTTDFSLVIPGFVANKGWDPTTGLGTPIVSNLVPLL